MNRKLYLYTLLSFAFLISLEACIKRVDLDIDTTSQLLVVNGLITDQPGPYTISLFLSQAYLPDAGQQVVNQVAVSGALVQVEDDLGNVVTFRENTPGQYFSPEDSFRGEIGRTYTLHIETQEGASYQSVAEELLPVPDLDSLTFEVKDTTRFIDDLEVDEDFIQVFAHFQDPPGQRNNYKWQWTGDIIFGLETFIPPPPRQDTPNICYYEVLPEIFDPYEDELNSLSDISFNGQYTQKAALTLTRPALNFRFFGGVSVRIAQSSLTPQAHQYWSDIRRLLDAQGNIFDPAPFRIRGNIENINDRSEIVLGYFGASAISYARKTIKSPAASRNPCDDICPPNQCFTEIYCRDCRQFDSNFNLVPPDFW